MLRLTLLVLLSMGPLLGRAEEQMSADPLFSQKAYYFEHRLLPKLTHTTNGGFFSDLSRGSLDDLIQSANNFVGKEFAQKIAVRALPDATRVLITFPEPGTPPLCFFALLEKDGGTFHYFTLELTKDLLGDGSKTVLGEWDEQGGHRNLGPRQYSDEAHFLAELTGRTQAKAGQPSGPMPKPDEASAQRAANDEIRAKTEPLVREQLGRSASSDARRVTVTVNLGEPSPVDGWAGRWRMRGTATVRNYRAIDDQREAELRRDPKLSSLEVDRIIANETYIRSVLVEFDVEVSKLDSKPEIALTIR